MCARGAAEARTKAGQLRALIKKKNVVEYEARRATIKEAADAVERAGRIVEWVRTVVLPDTLTFICQGAARAGRSNFGARPRADPR